MNFKNFHLLFLALAFLVSCEEEVSLNLDQIAPKLVVNALVTDKPNWSWVNLSLSTPFDSKLTPRVVDDALIIIRDEDGLIDTFQYYDLGYYFKTDNWTGVVGKKYFLEIYYNGELFESSSEMLPVPQLDSINYRYGYNVESDKTGYFVSAFFQEPPGISNYYRWLYYRNDSLAWTKEYISTDQLFSGEYVKGYEFRKKAKLGDTIRIEQYSLQHDAYEFLRQLKEQEKFGDPFDTPPANVQGNISNGAIGLFMVSAVSSRETVIE